MPILRNKTQNNFTMISNNIFRDKDLGLKDRGLLCTLMSLPDSWEFSISGLSSIIRDGKDSIRASLNYLEKLGYIARYQDRNNMGRFETILEVIAERSQDSSNHDGFTVSENPTRRNQHGETDTENTTEYKKDYLTTTDDNENEKSIIPSFKKSPEKKNKADWNDRMNEIPNINTFIDSTKRRVNYTALQENLNESELLYADRIIIVIAAYIADKRLRGSLKVSGKYIDDDKAIPHLLKYRYAEVFAVVKNMVISKVPIDKPDSYYLTSLDKQLMINDPDLYNTIDNPLPHDTD